MRVLIADDEPLARERIRTLLAEEGGVEVVGECGDGEEAVESIARLAPEVVFLDVQMPELSGFEVLEALEGGPLPVVVFVTAYDEYALRAFDAHAVDYLLKPFHRSRFQGALERARLQLAARAARSPRGPGDLDERLRTVLDELRPRAGHAKRLVVRQGPRIVFVGPAEVDWIDAEGNYARLHVGERTYLLRETMSHLEERLDPERFLRIHRSTIVNLDHVREIEPLAKGSFAVVLRDGTRLTSTRGYRDRIQALIDGAS